MGAKCVYISSLLLQIALFVLGDNAPGCNFPKHQTQEMKNGEKQIAPLVGKRFRASDAGYNYDIGICTDAIDPKTPDYEEGTGVLQISKTDGSSIVVGKYTVADIVAGPDWVFLEYNGGSKYHSHCMGADNKTPENRKARIMFICDRASQETQPVVLEEQNNKTDACYYLFEFATSAVCPAQPLVTFGLSVGSVLLIVFCSVLAFYLIAGCAYNRFVRGAKGIQQVPNLSFWEDFGNLQADGCDLVCRSRKSKQPKTYKGIGDDQLQDIEERTDDHLLPM